MDAITGITGKVGGALAKADVPQSTMRRLK
jgi:hypothetical protein